MRKSYFPPKIYADQHFHCVTRALADLQSLCCDIVVLPLQHLTLVQVDALDLLVVLADVFPEGVPVPVEPLALRTGVPDAVVVEVDLHDVAPRPASGKVGAAHFAHEALGGGDQLFRLEGFHVCNGKQELTDPLDQADLGLRQSDASAQQLRTPERAKS